MSAVYCRHCHALASDRRPCPTCGSIDPGGELSEGFGGLLAATLTAVAVAGVVAYAMLARPQRWEAIRTALDFAPGTKYQYSSMGILLAARIAEEIGGTDILTLVDRTVFQPLGMKHSAQGLGPFKLEDMVSCQMDGAAPESGAGDPKAREWDWNSPYWRKLGAPWGGTHASAPDVAAFLAEFLGAGGRAVKPETARLMVENQNPKGLIPRGLGFGVGKGAGSAGCSDRTFGHTGSTGTLCWADPASETICVVHTSLPRRGADRHPRDLAGERVAAAARG